MQLVLDAYGISYDWIKENGGSVTFTSQSDGSTLFQDGHLDVWAGLSSAPTPYIEEMAVSKDLVILEIDQDVINKLVSDYGYGTCEVPAGAYGMEKAVATVASSVVLIVNKTAPDDFVYNFTKGLFVPEFVEKLVAISNTFDKVSPEFSSKDLGCQLHPGAIKYYQEQHVL